MDVESEASQKKTPTQIRMKLSIRTWQSVPPPMQLPFVVDASLLPPRLPWQRSVASKKLDGERGAVVFVFVFVSPLDQESIAG